MVDDSLVCLILWKIWSFLSKYPICFWWFELMVESTVECCFEGGAIYLQFGFSFSVPDLELKWFWLSGFQLKNGNIAVPRAAVVVYRFVFLKRFRPCRLFLVYLLRIGYSWYVWGEKICNECWCFWWVVLFAVIFSCQHILVNFLRSYLIEFCNMFKLFRKLFTWVYDEYENGCVWRSCNSAHGAFFCMKCQSLMLLNVSKCCIVFLLLLLDGFCHSFVFP